jgi:hypothetical protein
MLMLVFWVVTLYGLVGKYQCFGEKWKQFVPLKHLCLPTGPHSITTHKTNITGIPFVYV